MAHTSGSRFHSCGRWLQFGMQCPFVGGEDEDVENGEPPDDAPPTGVPVHLLAARRGFRINILEQAEEIAAAAADAIPTFIEGKTVSLAERLGVPGAVAVGTGAVAGFAVRQIAKQLKKRGGFGGAGFNFPSVFDPAKAFRPP